MKTARRDNQRRGRLKVLARALMSLALVIPLLIFVPSGVASSQNGSGVVLLKHANASDAHMVYANEGVRRWVDASCLGQIQSAGLPVGSFSNWTTEVAIYPASSTKSCAQYRADLGGSTGGTTGGGSTGSSSNVGEFVAIPGYDHEAWILRTDGTRQWIDSSCRAQLVAAVGQPRSANWSSELANRSDTAGSQRLSCSALQAGLTGSGSSTGGSSSGGTTGTSSTDGIVGSAGSVVLLKHANASDAHMVYANEGVRRWVDASCLGQIQSAGLPVGSFSNWTTEVAIYPASSTKSCAQYKADLGGSTGGTTGGTNDDDAWSDIFSTTSQNSVSQRANQAFGDRLVARTIREHNNYGWLDECSSSTMRTRVGAYWQQVGQSWDGCTNQPWSAAFVSKMVAVAGGGNNFKYSAGHWEYIRDAFKGNRSLYNLALDIRQFPARPGDLVCSGRSSASGWDYNSFKNWAGGTASTPSHCDIVTAVNGDNLTVIGGNVGDQVKKQTRPKTDYVVLLRLDRGTNIRGSGHQQCLGTPKRANRTLLQMTSCKGTDLLQIVDGLGEGRMVLVGRCIGVAGRPSVGDRVRLETCGATKKDQQWELTFSGQIRLKHMTHLCLDAGSSVDLQKCNGSARQFWYSHNSLRI